MFTIATLSAFLFTSLIQNVSIGPNTFFTLNLSMAQGREAGLVSVLGGAAARLFHTLAVTLGLSALLAASPVAFEVVKYLGAGYLLYLGIQTLRNDTVTGTSRQVSALSKPQMFSWGFIVTLLNPGIAMFFLSFLPQFANSHAGPVWLQLLILGLIFTTTGTLYMTFLAFAAGSIGDWLRCTPQAAQALKWITGLTFIALACRAALASHR